MDIKKIDSNFADAFTDDKGLKHYPIPSEGFDLYGVFNDGHRFLRMPYDVAQKTSNEIVSLNAHTAGGRVRFATDSERVEIAVTYDGLCNMSHMPLSGSSGFVLIDVTDGTNKIVGTYYPDPSSITGFTICKSVNPERTVRDYILYMPLYNDVRTLIIGLDESAELYTAGKYRDVKPILYYGSSITQGGCASRPDTSYQAVISAWNNIDYINLGFSGNCKAQPAVAEYLGTVDCSALVCEYDYNAPDAEYLNETHYKLYKTFRAHQPKTPIIFMSRPSSEIDVFGDQRFKIVQRTYLTSKAGGDKNVWFINGYSLFGEDDRQLCTVDGVHPTDHGFYRMAKKIDTVLRKIF